LFWSVAILSLITTIIMLLQKVRAMKLIKGEDADNDDEGAGKGEST
jgi:hypothetical protein